ncbi:hypothetical protein A1OO_07820 [Enterovibrio norvegicus FF-33]|uniref:hypothetical protein n=1 Tax=Enterovibrio norvegicus TaxID=188144 RepID=UPI00030C64AD|nr:hypothetical protein [Enterovibrio norvegicus]OEE65708.1 hypothetical protein A1OO_07820 [Enterovibrio norvegicus FF-33]
MGWFTNFFKGIGDAISAVGDAIADVTTGIANVVSTAVSVVDEFISDVGDKIADATADIPIVNGITAAVATVIDGVTDAAEIVTHHFMMNVAQVGQATGTVISTTGDVVDAVCEGNTECIPEIIKDGIGEIVETADQHLAMHLEHDIELLQIPLEMVAEASSELLTGIIGHNDISQAPFLLDDAQSFVFDTVIHEGILEPAVDAWAVTNNHVFGNVVDQLSHADMGMGWATDHGMGPDTGHSSDMGHGTDHNNGCGCGDTTMPAVADEFMWV